MSSEKKTLQAMVDGVHGKTKTAIRKTLSTTPVIQSVLLPYEAPQKGAEKATLRSYLHLIKFRKSAVERTMGKNGQEWFGEHWEDLIGSKSVDQALEKVQAFIGAVLDKITQNENMRKEILPWQDNGDI